MTRDPVDVAVASMEVEGVEFVEWDEVQALAPPRQTAQIETAKVATGRPRPTKHVGLMAVGRIVVAVRFPVPEQRSLITS